MSVDPFSLKKSSIRRKVVSYYAGWQSGLHTKLWDFKRMRVLFLTPSKARVESMITMTRKVTGGKAPNLFLFVDRQTLASEGPFAPIWRTTKDDHVALVD